MKRHLIVWMLAAGVLPAFALNTVSPEMDSCTGVRSTTETEHELVLDCTGNFSLYGGMITSDVKLVITSTHTVTIDQMLLRGRGLEIYGQGVVLGNSARIESSENALVSTLPRGSVGVGSPGQVSVSAGARISVAGSNEQPIDVVSGVSAGTAGTVQLQPSLLDVAVGASAPLSVEPGGSVTLQQDEGTGGGAIAWLELVWLSLVCGVCTFGRRHLADD